MIYTFKCEACDYHEELWGIKMDERTKVLKCPECKKKKFKYDFALTMKGSRVAYHEDVNSFMERKMAGNKSWSPPPAQGGKAKAGYYGGKGGAGRHYPGDPRYTKKEI